MTAIGRSTGGQTVRGQPIGRVHQDNQNNHWQMVVYKPVGPPIAHRRPAFIVVVDVLAGARALLTPSPLQVCSPGPLPSALLHTVFRAPATDSACHSLPITPDAMPLSYTSSFLQ